jgi:hypothetical protein
VPLRATSRLWEIGDIVGVLETWETQREYASKPKRVASTNVTMT